MRPCCRAAGPAMVLVTFREPGAPSYTSIRFTGTTLPGGTVTSPPLPDTVAVTVAVAPSAVSVMVHTEPAGIPSKPEQVVAHVGCQPPTGRLYRPEAARGICVSVERGEG